MMGICASGEKEELGDSVLVLLHPCPLPLSLLAWHCSSDFNEGTGENALMVPIFQMLRAAALCRPPLPRGIFWAMRLQSWVPKPPKPWVQGRWTGSILSLYEVIDSSSCILTADFVDLSTATVD